METFAVSQAVASHVVPPVVTPFTIVIDDREKLPLSLSELSVDTDCNYDHQSYSGPPVLPPHSLSDMAAYSFQNIRSDAKQHRRPVTVQTVKKRILTGDYTLLGYEDRIAVERKSLSDLYGTLGQNRRRFEAELERLSSLILGYVIVEAPWKTILTEPPIFSALLPKTIHRSVIAWQMQFPTVHWWAVDDRRLGEITTFRILERYWKTCCVEERCGNGDVSDGQNSSV